MKQAAVSKILVLTVLVAAFTHSASASAQLGPVGQMQKEKLSCGNITDAKGELAAVGVDFSMDCYTQALAPQDFLRGCVLVSRVSVPGASINQTILAVKDQSVDTAHLESPTGDIKAEVEKSIALDVLVKFSDDTQMKCTSVK